MRYDAPTRYTALGLLASAFLAALAVSVHGYWADPGYQPPPMVVFLIGSAVTTAAHVLGVQQGQQTSSQGVQLGADTATNGHLKNGPPRVVNQ